MTLRILSYTLFQALIKDIIIGLVIHMLTSSDICFALESLTLVSDLYGLIRRMLYVVCVAPHCKFTVTLVNTVLSKVGPYMVFHIYMQYF